MSSPDDMVLLRRALVVLHGNTCRSEFYHVALEWLQELCSTVDGALTTWTAMSIEFSPTSSADLFQSLSGPVLPFCLHVLALCASALSIEREESAEERKSLSDALCASVASTNWSSLIGYTVRLSDDNHSLTCLMEAIDAVSKFPSLRRALLRAWPALFTEATQALSCGSINVANAAAASLARLWPDAPVSSASQAADATAQQLLAAVVGEEERARTGALRVLSQTADSLWRYGMSATAEVCGAEEDPPAWWLALVQQLGSVEPHHRRLAAGALAGAWAAGAQQHTVASACLVRALRTMFAAGGAFQPDAFRLTAQLLQAPRPNRDAPSILGELSDSDISSAPAWLDWLALPLSAAAGREEGLAPGHLQPAFATLQARLFDAWRENGHFKPQAGTLVTALDMLGDSTTDTRAASESCLSQATTVFLQYLALPSTATSTERLQRAEATCLGRLLRASLEGEEQAAQAAIAAQTSELVGAFFSRLRSTPATAAVLEALTTSAVASRNSSILRSAEARAALARLKVDRRWEVRDGVLSILCTTLQDGALLASMLRFDPAWWRELQLGQMVKAALQDEGGDDDENEASFVRITGLRTLEAIIRADVLQAGTDKPTDGERRCSLDAWQIVHNALASPEVAVRTAGAAALVAILAKATADKKQLRLDIVSPILQMDLAMDTSLEVVVGVVSTVLDDEDWEVRLDAWQAAATLAGKSQGQQSVFCTMGILDRLRRAVEDDMHVPVRQWAHEALQGLLDYVAGKDWTQQPEAKRKKTEKSWHPLSKALSDSHGASPCTAAACAWRALQADGDRAALEKHIKSSRRLAVSARRTAAAEELAALDGGCTLQDMVPDCC